MYMEPQRRETTVVITTSLQPNRRCDSPHTGMESTMRVRIENVTASIKLDRDIDIRNLSLEHMRTESSEGHPVIIFRPSEAVAVQLYENGNVISTGTRSTFESRRVIVETLENLGLEYDPENIQVRDIMASTLLDHDINLEKAYVAFGSIAEYNPEWFSGVILHYDSLGTTGIIYSNGKVVVSGASNMDMVYDSFEAMMRVLSSIERS